MEEKELKFIKKLVNKELDELVDEWDLMLEKILNRLPNALTRDTIDKAMNGIDVETVDSVEELFKEDN